MLELKTNRQAITGILREAAANQARNLRMQFCNAITCRQRSPAYSPSFSIRHSPRNFKIQQTLREKESFFHSLSEHLFLVFIARIAWSAVRIKEAAYDARSDTRVKNHRNFIDLNADTENAFLPFVHAMIVFVKMSKIGCQPK